MILLGSGRMLDIFDEEPDFTIEDIAISLSRECRFSGQTNMFFSVAQHSLCVANLVSPQYRFEALLHDATEAFLRDIATPIKRHLPDYIALEEKLDLKIRKHFKLPETLSPEVAKADQRALNIERALFLPKHKDWELAPDFALPVVKMFLPLSPEQALNEFLIAYNVLKL